MWSFGYENVKFYTDNRLCIPSYQDRLDENNIFRFGYIVHEYIHDSLLCL